MSKKSWLRDIASLLIDVSFYTENKKKESLELGIKIDVFSPCLVNGVMSRNSHFSQLLYGKFESFGSIWDWLIFPTMPESECFFFQRNLKNMTWGGGFHFPPIFTLYSFKIINALFFSFQLRIKIRIQLLFSGNPDAKRHYFRRILFSRPCKFVYSQYF